MAEWLARRASNPKIMGSSSIKASRLIKNNPAWATGDNDGASVHSAVNEYLAIDRDGNCTLDYLWSLEACKRMYTPHGYYRSVRDNNM